MSRWYKKKYDSIIRRWKNDELSLADAAGELHWLGFNAIDAWHHLERI